MSGFAQYPGSEVRARPRLRITLTPDDLAADGRTDPFRTLLLGSDLKKGRNEHRYPLVHNASGNTGRRKLVGYDRQLPYVQR